VAPTIEYASMARVVVTISDGVEIHELLYPDDEEIESWAQIVAHIEAKWSASDTKESDGEEPNASEPWCDLWVAFKPDIPPLDTTGTPWILLRGGTRDDPCWFPVWWHTDMAQGHVVRLDQINQGVEGTWCSHSGNKTFNYNVLGDFSVQVVHRIADPELGNITQVWAPLDMVGPGSGDARILARASRPNFQIYPGCIQVDRCVGRQSNVPEAQTSPRRLNAAANRRARRCGRS
jgi:hypothetical protein